MAEIIKNFKEAAMKITGFSIKMGSERTYSTSYSTFEKREVYVKNADSGGFISGDNVSISRESYSKTQLTQGFKAFSESVTSRNTSNAENTKPVVETMTKALTGQNISLTSLYSKSNENRSVSPLRRNMPSGDQSVNIMNISRSYFQTEAESTSISSAGTIQTNDGRNISFKLFLEMQRNIKKEGNDFTSGDARALTDPLVINFSGKPPELSDSVFTFDIDSDGKGDSIHSPGKGTGFLALDINKDGKINNGKELFGPSTGNGFGELSAYDSNSDGWLDENDEVFSNLVIWSKDEKGEDTLVGLESTGIGAIYTGYTDSEYTLSDKTGGTKGIIRRTGVYVKEDGEVQNIFQLDLAKKQTSEDSTASETIKNQERRGTAENPGSGAKAVMLKNMKEQLEKMKEAMTKGLEKNQRDISFDKDELLEKMKNRLEDLMKFFDEKVRAGRVNGSRISKISGYA